MKNYIAIKIHLFKLDFVYIISKFKYKIYNFYVSFYKKDNIRSILKLNKYIYNLIKINDKKLDYLYDLKLEL
jgi:hypothetical protein